MQPNPVDVALLAFAAGVLLYATYSTYKLFSWTLSVASRLLAAVMLAWLLYTYARAPVLELTQIADDAVDGALGAWLHESRVFALLTTTTESPVHADTDDREAPPPPPSSTLRTNWQAAYRSVRDVWVLP
jgi:hypothetical protein